MRSSTTGATNKVITMNDKFTIQIDGPNECTVEVFIKEGKIVISPLNMEQMAYAEWQELIVDIDEAVDMLVKGKPNKK